MSAKNTPPSRYADQFVVRLPDGMRDRIAEVAKANGRSMNAEIVLRMEQSFSENRLAGVADPSASSLASMRFESAQKDMAYEILSIVAAKLAVSARALAESVGGTDNEEVSKISADVIRLATEVADKFKPDEIEIAKLADGIEEQAAVDASYLRQLASSLSDPTIKVVRSNFAEAVRKLRKQQDQG